jgi:4-hydroxy-3-methylbut-2-en-1-yl diphosphate synthase IspG/GcpE
MLAGSVKSSVGLGILLYNGIGDPIRDSLTGDPQQDIYAQKSSNPHEVFQGSDISCQMRWIPI